MRYWKRAIELASLVGVDTMNSEFNGNPREAASCEAQFWRSMEELLPVFEREGIRLVLEPHPDDFEEDGKRAIDLIRALNTDNVSFLYCTPHTFHQGNDVDGILASGALTTLCHLSDAYDHTASSSRYIVNPPGSQVPCPGTVDIGQGEFDFDACFAALERNVSTHSRLRLRRGKIGGVHSLPAESIEAHFHYGDPALAHPS